MTIDDQKLWTLMIKGPTPFEFQLPGNPSVSHEGGVSVAHLVLRRAEVGALRLLVASQGGTLTGWPMVGQSDAQSEERQAFLAMSEEGVEWPTPECPMCPWFDPLSYLQLGGDPKGFREPCGIRAMPEESVQTLLLTSSIHVQAKVDCQR